MVNMTPKQIVAIVMAVCVTIIFIGSLITGVNGNLHTFCISTLTALIGFILGEQIIPPGQKKLINQSIEAVINAKLSKTPISKQ